MIWLFIMLIALGYCVCVGGFPTIHAVANVMVSLENWNVAIETVQNSGNRWISNNLIHTTSVSQHAFLMQLMRATLRFIVLHPPGLA